MPQSWFLGSRAGKSCKFRGRGQQRDFIVCTRVGEVGGYVKPTMFRLIDRDLCSSACALDIYICGCVRSVNLNGVRACVSGYLLNEADCKDRDSVVFIHISRYSTEWHTGRHAGWETTLAERAGGSQEAIHLRGKFILRRLKKRHHGFFMAQKTKCKSDLSDVMTGSNFFFGMFFKTKQCLLGLKRLNSPRFYRKPGNKIRQSWKTLLCSNNHSEPSWGCSDLLRQGSESTGPVHFAWFP